MKYIKYIQDLNLFWYQIELNKRSAYNVKNIREIKNFTQFNFLFTVLDVIHELYLLQDQSLSSIFDMVISYH